MIEEKLKHFCNPLIKKVKEKTHKKKMKKKIGKNHSDNKNIRFNKGLFIYYAI